MNNREEEEFYKQKYLKYKAKYLEAKNKIEGGYNCKGTGQKICILSPTCTWNNSAKECQSKCKKHTSEYECTKNKCDWWSTGCEEKQEQIFK
jgi:hypothetical protein